MWSREGCRFEYYSLTDAVLTLKGECAEPGQVSDDLLLSGNLRLYGSRHGTPGEDITIKLPSGSSHTVTTGWDGKYSKVFSGARSYVGREVYAFTIRETVVGDQIIEKSLLLTEEMFLGCAKVQDPTPTPTTIPEYPPKVMEAHSSVAAQLGAEDSGYTNTAPMGTISGVSGRKLLPIYKGVVKEGRLVLPNVGCALFNRHIRCHRIQEWGWVRLIQRETITINLNGEAVNWDLNSRIERNYDFNINTANKELDIGSCFGLEDGGSWLGVEEYELVSSSPN